MEAAAQDTGRSAIMAYAFAVPIPSGKTEAVRRFTEECLGPRRAEFDRWYRDQCVTTLGVDPGAEDSGEDSIPNEWLGTWTT
jgi:hypothetical protein